MACHLYPYFKKWMITRDDLHYEFLNGGCFLKWMWDFENRYFVVLILISSKKKTLCRWCNLDRYIRNIKIAYCPFQLNILKRNVHNAHIFFKGGISDLIYFIWLHNLIGRLLDSARLYPDGLFRRLE